MSAPLKASPIVPYAEIPKEYTITNSGNGWNVVRNATHAIVGTFDNKSIAADHCMLLNRMFAGKTTEISYAEKFDRATRTTCQACGFVAAHPMSEHMRPVS